MLLPYLKANENTRVQLKVFGGLDRRDKISNSSLSEMVNISPEAIPSLVPREARKLIAEASGATEICTPEYTGGELNSFTGVRGTKFYYKGVKAEGSLTEGRKSIADFNGKICIFPDKLYYDYLPSQETGEVCRELLPMEKTMSFAGAYFYSSYNDVTGLYEAYISASGVDFTQNFSVGDSIVISGCGNNANNTKQLSGRNDVATDADIVSVVVQKVSVGRIDVLLFNKKGEKKTFKTGTEAESITVKVAIPDMDNICVHNNRLWGTASSGEYIYASKLGDCMNFNSFQGIADDSWYGAVGTAGGFTGICSYRTAVVAFKRGCIHHIYGDAPVNFSMPKQTAGGCIDGKSICEIDGILYYLSDEGFMAYCGGEPYPIGEELKLKYLSCASGSDGRHYYASAVRQDGVTDVLVYTPSSDVWVKEDNVPFDGFCNYNGSLYGIAEGEMWKMTGGDEPTSWCVVSKRFTYDMIDKKGLNTLWLRMDMEENSTVRVYVSADNNDFVLCKTINGRGFSVYRVPVRFGSCESFRVMVEGVGRVVLHDIELCTYGGGRSY